jgi:urease accessory protein
MPGLRATTMPAMGTGMNEAFGAAALYRMLAWLSPGFPIGAFSYSHGLENAVQSGGVCDRGTLQGWIGAILAHGAGRMDTDTFRDAHRAASAQNLEALTAANRRGLAFRATSEMALETTAQGEAFLAACRAAWPEPFLETWANLLEQDDEVSCLAAAVGAATARPEAPLEMALTGYLYAMGANLVSAGLRLGIIGQTDGQRIIAALEPVIANAVASGMTRDPAGFGSATIAVDLASMAHETQYSRLFRS